MAIQQQDNTFQENPTRSVKIPELSLIVLIGASGSGKSTFARQHFQPTEVLSSDFCRGLVADDENDQSATTDAFDVLHYIAAKRLAAGRLTVVDATNVQPEARRPLIALARQYHCLPVAIVFNVLEKICHERNSRRPDRNFGPHVIRRHIADLRRSLRGLGREGFRNVHVFSSPEEIATVSVVREPLWNNRKSDTGPFDVIGDIHGCYDELRALLDRLGYEVADDSGDGTPRVRHPAGRRAIFLGDLVDRGPGIVSVLRLVMNMVESDAALCIPGNHERKLLRKLQGRNVQITHGLAESLAQVEQESEDFRARVVRFLDGLVSHYVLDEGRLVVAHAGLPADMQGRGSGRVREFALYGETTGETDEYGLPVRYNWAGDYRGQAIVVYGHTPVPEPEWLNGTINIDTGCVFGGRLTALRYPERELVSVPAARVYYAPSKPFLPDSSAAPDLSIQQVQDDVLDIADVTGKRLIETRLQRAVTIREKNAIAAIEVMSRFAADPKWLVYLPPTMSPVETSSRPDYLEYPAEVFEYYRREGIPHVICQEKHMGSRALIVVCRDPDTARRRFGVTTGESGICYTRTGRRFFEDQSWEDGLLARLRATLDESGLWDELNSQWLLLDCELLPWSAKAQDLLKRQYAATGAAARAAFGETLAGLNLAAEQNPEAAELRERFAARAQTVERYVAAYQRYCWPVESLEDLRLAPFHVLASEGAVHSNRDHRWHQSLIERIVQSAPELILPTAQRVVDVTDPGATATATTWWEELTERGGEGMVVKPLEFVTRGPRGLVQPAVKCRGREYLRIIYGPEYDAPENLRRLRSRHLGAKRSLALREFALGIEGLERFVRGEPLRRVHECVFGVLALESEPVDPRL